MGSVEGKRPLDSTSRTLRWYEWRDSTGPQAKQTAGGCRASTNGGTVRASSQASTWWMPSQYEWQDSTAPQAKQAHGGCRAGTNGGTVQMAGQYGAPSKLIVDKSGKFWL
jgi:hypothetical protein